MRLGLWALPVYGVLLGLSTLTHQPPVDDFDAYARYVTTDVFLISHLGASVLGAALAVLGAVAVTAYLFPRPGAVAGLVLTTVANTFLAAAFGAAAFVQPGLGRAHLAGVPGMAAINDDTAYGPALFGTALSASFLFMVAAVVLGTTIARADRQLRWHGVAYAVLIVVFTVGAILWPPLQPIAGFAFAVATAALAVRLPRTARARDFADPAPVLTTGRVRA
ncbi:hypothetical protein [Actinoplanes sp. M2I2]|uniref:hypothetical protein n=1 Tax=Actinoplanes sp. M2I2 TaxID=1734444 RepID=UPI00202176C5|nr:hypothetical protein [Actinoplanes sp. M2I2]